MWSCNQRSMSMIFEINCRKFTGNIDDERLYFTNAVAHRQNHLKMEHLTSVNLIT